MRSYLKHKLADTLLCIALTVSLVPTVCSGFALTGRWQQSLLAAALCSAVLQVVFTLLSRRRVTVRLGIAAGAVLAAAAFAYMRAVSPLSDEASNSAFIFALVQIVTALLVFLLSRTRLGVAVMFLVGNLICAGSHFLLFPAPAWCFYLFLAAVFVLFLHRVCTVSAAKAELGAVSVPKYLRQTALLLVVGFGAALGLYFGVVAPLAPPTQELKLITELRSMELLQVLGISGTEIILDPELTSEAPPEDTELGDESGEEESDAPDGLEETPSPKTPDTSKTLGQQISNTLQEAAEAIRYDGFVWSRLWLLLLIPLAIAAAYGLRVYRKKQWRKRVRALPREDAVANYYRFFLSRLGRAGIKKSPDSTLREFAENAGKQMEPFETGGVRFGALTAVYEQVLYGRHSVSDEEYTAFERFYDGFYPALRREVGTAKYYLKAFIF